MIINSINTTNFKGYDARPLKGFLMNCNNAGIATEMSAIGAKEGFKIFSVAGKTCKEGVLINHKGILNIWAQDIWTMTKTGVIFQNLSKQTQAVLRKFNLTPNTIQQTLRESDGTCLKILEDIKKKDNEISEYSNEVDCKISVLKEKIKERKNLEKDLSELREDIHIAGGNIYLVQSEGHDELLIGENELEIFDKNEIKDMYSVDKIIPLPQMDYHIDLFVRPLDKKRILLADDNKTLEVLDKGIKKLQSYILTLPKDAQKEYKEVRKKMLTAYLEFKKNIKENKNAKAEEVENALIENGYSVIRVPGRLYGLMDDPDLKGFNLLNHHFNYMNANLIQNQNNEIVYITNKSNYDKKIGLTPDLSKEIDFSFEKEFIKSISPFVKKEHIYFVEGEDNYVSDKMLWEAMGGIHCACAEIPEGVSINE